MKKFEKIELHNHEYKYLIIANSYENPINDFVASSKIPGIRNGNVIFDLLLINGIKPNRFISVSVINSKIDTSSIKVVENVSNEIQDFSSLYFKTNSSLIKNSILPNSLKFTLLHEIVQ